MLMLMWSVVTYPHYGTHRLSVKWTLSPSLTLLLASCSLFSLCLYLCCWSRWAQSWGYTYTLNHWLIQNMSRQNTVFIDICVYGHISGPCMRPERPCKLVAEMRRYNPDLFGISKTRWIQSGQQRLMNGELLLYLGHYEDKAPRTNWVGFLLSRTTQRALTGWEA